MADFRFYIPIQVRYGDLDPQWHVNHTRFLTFIEQARFDYLQRLGLFDGVSFLDLRLIIADVHIAFKAPIKLGQGIRVGTRTAKIGTKSITFEYRIEDDADGTVMADCELIAVAYDYRSHQTVSIPDDWRKKIGEFEGVAF